ALIEQVGALLDAGFSPIVYCHFIATAKYVAERLRRKFDDAHIECITGEMPNEQREMVVAEIPLDRRRILVATDCLSEGVNLQEQFDAVIHYDLSWNPTRHEQREGRVDRFGQQRPVVR